MYNFVAYYVVIKKLQKKFQEKKFKSGFVWLKVPKLDFIGFFRNWEQVWH